jgi:hypothetical protein
MISIFNIKFLDILVWSKKTIFGKPIIPDKDQYFQLFMVVQCLIDYLQVLLQYSANSVSLVVYSERWMFRISCQLKNYKWLWLGVSTDTHQFDQSRAK